MYFDNITTMDGLRAEYRRLIKINHPDAGGDEATMKAINLAYEAAVDYIRRHGEKAEADKAAADVPAEFMAAVSAVVACPGLIVEIVGSWVWVTGDTYRNRDRLKAAGYKWAAKKSAWYWHPADQAVGRSSRMSLDQIRDKYGAQRVGLDYAPHILTA